MAKKTRNRSLIRKILLIPDKIWDDVVSKVNWTSALIVTVGLYGLPGAIIATWLFGVKYAIDGAVTMYLLYAAIYLVIRFLGKIFHGVRNWLKALAESDDDSEFDDSEFDDLFGDESGKE